MLEVAIVKVESLVELPPVEFFPDEDCRNKPTDASSARAGMPMNPK